MTFEVLRSGPCTTVQDFGRIGYLSTGIAPSGAMDVSSLALANILVGNSTETAGLEFCMQGPKLKFDEEAYIAITGGCFPTTLNGAGVQSYTTICVHPGDVLNIGYASVGNYGYLAIGGNFAIDESMGSRSTNLKAGIGGINGQKLTAGIKIKVNTKRCSPLRAIEPIMPEKGPICIRIIAGPQKDMFTDAGWKTFLSQPYQITPQADRMGIRLNGPEIESMHGTDIISDGTAFGAIQVPGNGKPIVLMADRQTTGGYAKIGVVASVDLPRLAQAGIGTEVRFICITVAEAQKIYTDYWTAMRHFAKIF